MLKAEIIYYCRECKGHFYPFQLDHGHCPECGSGLVTDEWYCPRCHILEDEQGHPDPVQAYGYMHCPEHS